MNRELKRDSRPVIQFSIPYSLFPICLLVIGCCPHAPATQPYTGPTLTLDRIVEKINANNAKIPSLWSELDFKATIIDDKETHTGAGEGVMMYRRPGDFRLVTKEVGNVIFDIGSNAREFWLATGPQTGDTIWWGIYGDQGPAGPSPIGATRTTIPISPAAVAQVLCVSTIDTNFFQPPVPVMRFDADADAYVILFEIHAADRWLAEREVWYDRKSLHPTRVLLYDANGRVVLRATLGQYEQVQIDNAPTSDWPWIAGDYKLIFPDTGSTMEITLYQNGALIHKGRLPTNASFTMPPLQNFDHGYQITGQ
ncbi:MAG TPA: hypothetical protein VHY37_11735 [Tepidisphaeraceae bacterium]|jgi:outer membrane lipoprotein-sorting protein|nr:hypothetical protein [Tepidisphaeraceae bacterium]